MSNDGVDEYEMPIDLIADINGLHDAEALAGSGGLGRRDFLVADAGSVAGMAVLGASSGEAQAQDIPPSNASVSAPPFETGDYSRIPQRLHVYPASDRAKQIVHKSTAMDSLFSAIVP